MSRYKNIAEQLHNLNSKKKKSMNNNIFTCYYCPSAHHQLCGHQDKCILASGIADVLISIKKTNKKIQYFKNVDDIDSANKLVLQRKELFKEYYSITTKAGGFI